VSAGAPSDALPAPTAAAAAAFSTAHGHALRALYLSSCCAPLADPALGEAAEAAAACDAAGADQQQQQQQLALEPGAAAAPPLCSCGTGAPSAPATYAEQSLHHLLFGVPLPAGIAALRARLLAHDSSTDADELGLGLMPELLAPAPPAADAPTAAALARALAAAKSPTARRLDLSPPRATTSTAAVRAASAIPFAAGDAAAAIAITVPPQSPPLAQRTSPHGQQPQQLEQGASNSGSFRAARRVASGASWHNFSLASMCGFANVHASPPQRGSSWRSGGGGAVPLERPAVSTHVVHVPAPAHAHAQAAGGRPPVHSGAHAPDSASAVWREEAHARLLPGVASIAGAEAGTDVSTAPPPQTPPAYSSAFPLVPPYVPGGGKDASGEGTKEIGQPLTPAARRSL
jgi:hypothetical protein